MTENAPLPGLNADFIGKWMFDEFFLGGVKVPETPRAVAKATTTSHGL